MRKCNVKKNFFIWLFLIVSQILLARKKHDCNCYNKQNLYICFHNKPPKYCSASISENDDFVKMGKLYKMN
jgi:hypothetical protein